MSANEKERRGPKAERREATRAALVAAARELFAERGYAAVGTEEVVQRAGVTRGALYHHFADKRDLFRAVYEQTEQEIVAAIAAQMAEAAQDDPWEVLAIGTRAFLDAVSDPALMRIGLLDGPAVLGWAEWREIGMKYGFGLVVAGLQAIKDAGQLRGDDVQALAHLMVGTLGEAAMLVANAEDPRAARQEIERALLGLLEGLKAP